ncbi:MAG: plasmid recombination protein [Oscillospiraceae bacterium]|nr:plasmid recombination protein [Oscillospiraceae bacterium]
MADKSVVRNQAYQKKGISIRERHNERENETYYNADIETDRKDLNVYFKQSEGSYAKTFDAMIADGTISVKGLKKDGTAKVFDEFVFDVNTEYFYRNGGYEYAKSFFEEAYRHAVEEIGGEQYILSAVMHADERNKALSEELGRDVYHYHLHVVYLPVVDKEVYFQKSHKNPELAGKLKEVIKQVSHSKKWPRYRTEKGWVNSYSLLQDRFHEHMIEAGFIGFERGERGSTAEHLSAEEYKAQKEKERAATYTAVVEQKQEAAAALDVAIEGKEKTAAKLDAQAEKKRERLDKLDETITVKAKAAATVAEIEAMGKPALIGSSFTVTADDMKTLKTLAKKSVTADDKVTDMRRRLTTAENERNELRTELDREKKSRPSLMQNLTWFDKFMAALKRAPKRLMAVIEDILREPPERQEQQHSTSELKRSNDMEH